MSIYYEYELEKGIKVLIEGPEPEEEKPIDASNTYGTTIINSQKDFNAALDGVNAQAKSLLNKFEILEADEIEVTFGIVTTGELGLFAIGKIGMEVNYEVTLRWKKTYKVTAEL